MKAILISIKPQWVVKILNGEKTIEIRKKFPSDYVGWVYIYVTKDNKKHLYPVALLDKHNKVFKRGYKEDDIDNRTNYLNGKVVARFWCDKVEKIRSYLEPEQWYMTSDLGGSGLLEKSYLSFKELDDYLLSGEGYAIHITKLEIFDKPKELSEFKTIQKGGWDLGCFHKGDKGISLTHAPQSWCYIEI